MMENIKEKWDWEIWSLLVMLIIVCIYCTYYFVKTELYIQNYCEKSGHSSFYCK